MFTLCIYLSATINHRGRTWPNLMLLPAAAQWLPLDHEGQCAQQIAATSWLLSASVAHCKKLTKSPVSACPQTGA